MSKKQLKSFSKESFLYDTKLLEYLFFQNFKESSENSFREMLISLKDSLGSSDAFFQTFFKVWNLYIIQDKIFEWSKLPGWKKNILEEWILLIKEDLQEVCFQQKFLFFKNQYGNFLRETLLKDKNWTKNLLPSELKIFSQGLSSSQSVFLTDKEICTDGLNTLAEIVFLDKIITNFYQENSQRGFFKKIFFFFHKIFYKFFRKKNLKKLLEIYDLGKKEQLKEILSITDSSLNVFLPPSDSFIRPIIFFEKSA